jgi:hypothetical protein
MSKKKKIVIRIMEELYFTFRFDRLLQYGGMPAEWDGRGAACAWGEQKMNVVAVRGNARCASSCAFRRGFTGKTVLCSADLLDENGAYTGKTNRF